MILGADRTGRVLAALAAAAVICVGKAAPPRTVVIPAGEFVMGSAKGSSWEKPPHKVVTPAFKISVTPITNVEYQQFRPDHRSPGDKAPDAPVTGVSYEDALDYCAWLSEQTGQRWMLPTEAWWERAARGGLQQKDYPWGDDPAASQNDPGQADPRENAFGVHAVHYNLWEWTADWYAPDYFQQSERENPTGPSSGVYRVLRGGGFRNDPDSATTYTRGNARPWTRSDAITFRVAQPLEGSAPELTQDRPAQRARTASAPTAAPRPSTPPSEPPPTRQAAAPAPRRPTPARRPEPPAPTPTSGVALVTAITFEAGDSAAVVRIRTNGAPQYRTMSLSNPDRLVVDLSDSRIELDSQVGEVAAGAAGVARVRYSQFSLDPPAVRVVVDSSAPLEHEIERTRDGLAIRVGR